MSYIALREGGYVKRVTERVIVVSYPDEEIVIGRAHLFTLTPLAMGQESQELRVATAVVMKEGLPT